MNFLSTSLPVLPFGSLSLAGGLAGAAGQIPDGIPPLVWLLVTLIGPALTGLAWRYGRIRAAGFSAKKKARATERKRIAEEHERRGRALLGDAAGDNDSEGSKLLAQAAEERVAAAAEEAEAAAIERETAHP